MDKRKSTKGNTNDIPEVTEELYYIKVHLTKDWNQTQL
jgi:hypothetical protein